GKYSRHRRVTSAAVSGSQLTSFGYQGFMRASMTIGGVRATWCLTSSVRAAWMSAAGSNRVNVVQRKLTVLATARSGSSLTTTSGHSAKAGWAAMRAGASASSAYDGASTTRQPGLKTRTVETPCGSSAAENVVGSVRTGSPRPSHTPFDPSLTRGPV